jgi:hypothetical protein
MSDKTHINNPYVKTKILSRLNSKTEQSGKVITDEMLPSITELIDSINVNIAPVHSENFEDCVVGWVTFCNVVLELITEKFELTKENFKNFYYSIKEPISKPVAQKTDYIEMPIEKKSETEEELKLRLLMICDEDVCDIPESDLDIEGLRQMGYVSTLETELDGEEIRKVASSLPVLRLRKGEEIISPYSGTNYIYRISENTFMDINTEEEFLVFFD